MLATQNLCVDDGDFCRLNPSFITSLAAPTTDTAKLTALTEAIKYKCGTYTDAKACNSDSRCRVVGGTCSSGDWVDARWYKGKAYCEGSLVDKHLGCLPTTTKDACTGNCVWKTATEMSAVTERSGNPSEAAQIRSVLYFVLSGITLPGIEPEKTGACTAAGLWNAEFDAIVAKGVKVNNGSTEYDFPVIFRAIESDLIGTCPGGTSLSEETTCVWYGTSPETCATAGPFCEFRWTSPGSGDCGIVDQLSDPRDPYYKALLEAANTCNKASTSACASTGRPISTGTTSWETLLTALPSYATGGAIDGTPSPAPKPKPTGSSPGKKGTASPPPRRRFSLFPPFRRAPPMARKL
ncbi:hypothetical protein HYH03_008798 [Edaphochlamys debaryana]|uniref:Uncharacterized protein n=1 Tax=Edaphochlamys debaryana TaxID=47281 RepID=A0A836BZ07_9CHLO|nr:hypothetical protein HYH03_008798 [Edaphochlamys debaryana]|eukprot:KAG2492883.1 hypothetical protein HYH03_008798 [Edaphochlamys debaryana]